MTSDIKSKKLRILIEREFHGDHREPLLVEGLLGKGIIVTPLADYKMDHLRICRPISISQHDMQKVITYCIERLGAPYDVRHIFDLLRLMFPVFFLPRQMLTSLYKPLIDRTNKKQICSSLLAEAFASVKFPILPTIKRSEEGKIEFIHRNPNLFVPKDFDLSPYFEIIKYPLFGLDNSSTVYRNLPWQEGVVSNDGAGYSPATEKDAEEKRIEEENNAKEEANKKENDEKKPEN